MSVCPQCSGVIILTSDVFVYKSSIYVFILCRFYYFIILIVLLNVFNITSFLNENLIGHLFWTNVFLILDLLSTMFCNSAFEEDNLDLRRYINVLLLLLLLL